MYSEAEAVAMLEDSVRIAPVIWKGEYPYFIHPLSDGVPRASSDLLSAARDILLHRIDWDNIDLILSIEAMGLPLASVLSVATGIPTVVARKRSYGMDMEMVVDQSTGYSKGTIWINDVKPGERILVVDDVVSTGGTMEGVLLGLEKMGANLAEVWTVFEKGDGMKKLIEKHNWPLKSLVKIEMVGAEVNILN
ncbi:MAG: hypoxanthine/guanine phosphoribosyltransferase [Candidatus Thalassarchaeaceae archaeon]|nr:hypoxanthine/guanine phosphoribosyltransferase [Candidatus Thalassarchaeaceae archaeon]